MNVPRILVGVDCTFMEIVDVLRARPTFGVLAQKIFDLAYQLGLPGVDVQSQRQKLLIGTLTIAEVLVDILEKWTAIRSSEATLEALIVALERNNLNDSRCALIEAFSARGADGNARPN